MLKQLVFIILRSSFHAGKVTSVTAIMGPIIAIEIGSAMITAACVEGGEITKQHQVTMPRTGHGGDLANAIADLVRKIMSASLRLGVTTSGIVANGGLTSFNPQTLPIENNYPIAAALRRRLGVHALVVNDAQAAAFHESRLMRKDANSFAFITVSTDIGAGLVLDGQLQIGRRGLAGRAGHITVDWAGRLCGCGRRGCVETLASGAAIARRASEITGQEMSTPAVFAAAHAGDERCIQVLEDAANALAAMIADLVAGLDIDLVRLGGSVGMVPGFLNRLRIAMERLPEPYRRPVEPARGDANAVLLGVAALLDETFRY